ncbi:hypothetical protein [Prosthecobacter sp.]|uniref:hypothetical protein n=1 Tax=Prosthecobacter sp. TaxID=1965333 RepID=UPI0037844CBB
MNNTEQIKVILASLLSQLPILLVSLVALIMIFARSKELSKASMWALLGFGLTLLLCIVIPVVQNMVQRWAIENRELTHDQRASIFTGISFLWSVLRAISYALLLVAVFAGRRTPPPAFSSGDIPRLPNP